MPPDRHNAYTRLMRPLLFRLDPETAHRLTIAALSLIPPLRPANDAPELASTVFGITFANPVGLAAGVDKDARALAGWNALGFGFAEVGTITPRPQPGNAPPRMWRLPSNHALINRLGFPGEGMEAAAARLRQASSGTLRHTGHASFPAMRVALNFGPNKDTPPQRVAEDYAALARLLAPFADFIVVNLSSPNTPGLRDWQAPERMRAIVEAVRAALPDQRRVPILVKIAPDLEPAQISAVCAAALDLAGNPGAGGIGIVATNTTLKREEVGVSAAFAGGLSGAPLLARSREVIAQVYRETGRRVPIIGVGGIAGAEDAYGHIRAGASLVEFYTAMIYRGPGLAREIKRGLVRLLARDGFRSISEAVGSAAVK
ncbi:MAG: quinone-dependent dihydroorotate dehydrogenase [Candidatus Binataceae bacterium]|jgi:dihydroorotate dehydrogenase